MYNPLRRGTPDVWYSGNKGDLWVEYKWLPKLPKLIRTRDLLSPLQLMWIEARHDEGRTVWVIVGSPEGNLIVKSPYDVELSKDSFLQKCCSTKHTALQIESVTCN